MHLSFILIRQTGRETDRKPGYSHMRDFLYTALCRGGCWGHGLTSDSVRSPSSVTSVYNMEREINKMDETEFDG